MSRYASRSTATPLTVAGALKCDRCGKPVSPWPLRRPDNCGQGRHVCIRQIGTVLQGWRDSGYDLVNINRRDLSAGRFL